MLKITNHSENFDGAIEINGSDVASVNGSVTMDNIYMNFNSYDAAATKAGKATVASDVGEFMGILLGDSAE